jgi:integrase
MCTRRRTLRLIVLLMTLAGMRRGEVCGLRGRDVHPA